MRNSFNKIISSALLGLLCLVLGLRLLAQPGPMGYYPSPLTGGLSLLQDLKGVWFDENGNRHIVPFNYFDRDEMQLSRSFELPNYTDLQDTLYLYCEAIAWSSEINLNGRLLAVTDDPFAEQLLPIQKSWLEPTNNALSINMSSKGLSFPWYPERFLGIFRQILLLQVDSFPRFPKFPESVRQSPKAVLFAAWSMEQKYLADSTIMNQLGNGLFSFPDRIPVVFPFRPSNQSQAMLASYGWKVMSDPESADSLVAYNAYPFSKESEHKNLHFWRDASMRPTSFYHHYQSKLSVARPELNLPDKSILVIFLMIPVLCLLLLKIAAPRAYGSLGEYLTKTKIYLDLIADNKFLKVEQRWLMNFLRMVVTAVTVALFLYYVQLSESWRILNVLGNQSILYRQLYGSAMPLWEIFVWAVTVVIGLNFAKYFMINGIGTIFRVYSLGASIQNLDVFAAFPLNLVPFLPATFIFFLDPVLGTVILRVWVLLFSLYSLRRAWLLYSGLGKLYQISGSLKILYICTLEILPWIVLI